MRSGPTVDDLKSWLAYDAETGVFVWLKSPRFNVAAGSIAGHKKTTGAAHLVIGLGGTWWGAHRLAWLYVTGTWPKCGIDHINGDPSDNRFSNLREASLSLNAQNRRRPAKSSTTGYLGVTETGSKSRPYRAQLTVCGRNVYIGIFESPEAAHQAYVTKKREVHEGCTL